MLENLSLLFPFLFLWIVFLYLGLHFRIFPNTIVDILSPLFFYPSLPLTFLSRYPHYWTYMTPNVLLGGMPIQFLSHPQLLRSFGVGGIINCCAEVTSPSSLYTHLDIQWLDLPTRDHCEPSISDIKKALLFIQQMHSQNSKVYIHCKAGHGRSAAIVFCYLKTILYPNWTMSKVQMFMNSQRKVRTSLYTQKNINTICNSEKNQ